jgi:hypothetical protein
MASRVKCEPHGGKNSKMKLWTFSWLSLKTKVEPGLRGSQVMSSDQRRLHQLRGVCEGFEPIGTKWVWKNKEGEKEEVVRNKSR